MAALLLRAYYVLPTWLSRGRVVVHAYLIAWKTICSALSCCCCCLQSVSQQLCELLLAAPSSAPWKQHLQEQQNKIAAMQDRLEQQHQEITTMQDKLHELSC